MRTADIKKAYFEWMFNLVCKDRYADTISYRKLLEYLHSVEFIYCIPNDSDRYDDGLDLRYRFAYIHPEFRDAERYLVGPCSVLEMMISLAIRCEETITTDPKIGDRTGQWFWKMIVTLGLGATTDNRFDEKYVEEVVSKFLHRKYESDGKGGLFQVKGCDCDLRDVEIWNQMCYYLDTLYG